MPSVRQCSPVIDADLNRDVIARVREAADLVDVAEEYVRLRKTGPHVRGSLPIPRGKDPVVFGRRRQGPLLLLWLSPGRRRLQIPDAAREPQFPRGRRTAGAALWCDSSHPRAPRLSNGERRAIASASLLEEARHFFAECLEGAGGSARRGPSLNAGGSRRTPGASFGFGFAPDEWRGLLEHLTRRHPEGALVEAGLAVRPDSGTAPYDRFRNRLTFPIRSGDGAFDRLRRPDSW